MVTVVSALCPEKCTCSNSTSQVSCADGELQTIPRGLPPSVTTLDLSGNHLRAIHEDSLASLRSVVNLKFTLNEITTIQDGSFKNLANLQTLDLAENKLKSIHQRTFRGANKLLHLDLSSNELDHIDGAFAEMTVLSRLDMRNNQIKRITQFTFRDLADLRYLLLTDNEITHIDKRAFQNLSKLMYLVLKGNPIHRVTRFEFNSYFLSYVDLSECGLKKIPRGLPNSIRYLQLRRNNMTTVNRHSFQDCPYVSILVLDENGIESIQERTFEHMTYLQQLWLNGNKLTKIPQPLPESLQRLLMDQNQIKVISDNFPVGSAIHTLSFMGNNITKVEPDALLKLSELKSVDLSNNKLQHVYGNTYMNASKLKTLQLSKNPLKYFHSHAFHGLTTLKTLSLAYVPTNVSMYPDIFQDLTKVKKLDLDSSPGIVRAIFSSDTFLGTLGSVEDLSLQSCELTTLRGDFPEFFANIGVLHISSSRWHCDTRLLWFRNWLLSTSAHVEAPESIVCISPDDVRGRALTSLSGFEFVQATTPAFTTTTTLAPLSTFPQTTTTQRAPSTTFITSSTDSPITTDSSAPTPNFDDSNKYEYETLDDADLEDILRDFENFPLDPIPKHNDDNSTHKLTWEELLLSRTLAPAKGSKLWEASTRDPTSHESKYIDENDPGIDIDFLGTGTPRIDAAGQNSNSDSDTSNSTLIIIIATTLATVVIAVVLITTIVYLLRKQKKRTPKKSKKDTYQNGIKYKHRNDVLYFMPANGEGGGGGGGTGQNGRVTGGESDHGDKDGNVTDSLQTATSKEGMTLIPGRDINHEGPLRVYKWEEF